VIGAILMKVGARRAWAAANRRDLDYLLRYVADDAVMEVPGRPPVGGRFVGREAWRAGLERWQAGLSSFRYHLIHVALRNPFALGLTNTVFTEFELEETALDGRTVTVRGVDVSEMARGKWVADRTYVFDLEAEEAMRSAAP